LHMNHHKPSHIEKKRSQLSLQPTNESHLNLKLNNGSQLNLKPTKGISSKESQLLIQTSLEPSANNFNVNHHLFSDIPLDLAAYSNSVLHSPLPISNSMFQSPLQNSYSSTIHSTTHYQLPPTLNYQQTPTLNHRYSSTTILNNQQQLLSLNQFHLHSPVSNQNQQMFNQENLNFDQIIFGKTKNTQHQHSQQQFDSIQPFAINHHHQQNSRQQVDINQSFTINRHHQQPNEEFDLKYKEQIQTFKNQNNSPTIIGKFYSTPELPNIKKAPQILIPNQQQSTFQQQHIQQQQTLFTPFNNSPINSISSATINYIPDASVHNKYQSYNSTLDSSISIPAINQVDSVFSTNDQVNSESVFSTSKKINNKIKYIFFFIILKKKKKKVNKDSIFSSNNQAFEIYSPPSDSGFYINSLDSSYAQINQNIIGPSLLKSPSVKSLELEPPMKQPLKKKPKRKPRPKGSQSSVGKEKTVCTFEG
ncbi:hypothetical protein HDU92_008294, partial [Lobulomyces angularis]